jgi:hypothetical protein
MCNENLPARFLDRHDHHLQHSPRQWNLDPNLSGGQCDWCTIVYPALSIAKPLREESGGVVEFTLSMDCSTDAAADSELQDCVHIKDEGAQ